MFGNSFEPVYPPTTKSRDLVKTLRVLLYIQLFLGFFKIFGGDFGSGFTDLIGCWILYQAYTYLSHCNVIIYSFFNGLNVIQLLAMIGVIIQNSESFFQNSYFPYGGTFLPMIVYSSLIFYIVSLYFAFEAYKEFKAITMEHSGLLGTGGAGGTELPQYRPPQRAQYGGFGKCMSIKN